MDKFNMDKAEPLVRVLLAMLITSIVLPFHDKFEMPVLNFYHARLQVIPTRFYLEFTPISSYGTANLSEILQQIGEHLRDALPLVSGKVFQLLKLSWSVVQLRLKRNQIISTNWIWNLIQ